ncbi:hypothetical protein O3P69_001666 [Scylla paramamosain]|uniref:Uncharacterized protein n=1 Tax=Scylla paramamosain TaxID=85552 RepID=A0AAW0UZ00_SCYPA
MRLTALLHVWFFSCSCVTLVPAIRLEPTEDGWEADAATMSGEAELMVAMERNHRHLMKEEPDPTAPDGVRVQFKGFMVTVLDYLAQGGNLHDRGWTVRALEFSDDSKLQRL